MPFGNRRLLHCAKPGSSDEVPAWEACGKVVKKEQRGFYEFVVSVRLCGFSWVIASEARYPLPSARLLADSRPPTSSSW
jgi:hypothetical protein